MTRDSLGAGFSAPARRHGAGAAQTGTAAPAGRRPPAASCPGASTSPARDPAIRPGDDFWRYANNSWFRANPIPADRTGWGVGTVLSEDVEAQLRDIVETAGRGTDPVSRQVAAISMRAIWTRPGSRRAAPRRCGPISTGSPRRAAATT